MDPIVNPVYEYKVTRRKVGEITFALGQTPEDWFKSLDRFATIVRPFFANLDHERLLAVYFDEGGQMTGMQVLADGGRTSVEADPLLVARSAIMADARIVVMVHNHPNGAVEPSDEDFAASQQHQNALEPFGILFADGVVVSDTEVASMRQRLGRRRHAAIVKGEYIPSPDDYNLNSQAEVARAAAELRLSAGAQTDPTKAHQLRLTADILEGKADPMKALMDEIAKAARDAYGFDLNGEDGPGRLN